MDDSELTVDILSKTALLEPSLLRSVRYNSFCGGQPLAEHHQMPATVSVCRWQPQRKRRIQDLTDTIRFTSSFKYFVNQSDGVVEVRSKPGL